MKSELEQKFYETFGIKKRCIRPKDCVRKGICRGAVACDFYTYPEITAERLLQMICVYNSTYTNGYTNYSLLNERNVEKLKEQILKNCLIVRNDIKQQIQQLFKEEV